MEPYCEKNRSQAGLSLVELLIVILVISVVAALALMQRGSANEQFQRQNAARELKVAFERARFDSVKRRAVDTSPDLRANVQVTATGFILRTYKEQSGVWDLADDQTYTLPAGIVVEPDVGSLPKTVIYNQRGEASLVGGGNPVFFICNGICSSATPSGKDVVLVTPTGTVNLLTGGTVPPPFDSPVVSSVPADDGINHYVVVPPSPTPMP